MSIRTNTPMIVKNRLTQKGMVIMNHLTAVGLQKNNKQTTKETH